MSAVQYKGPLVFGELALLMLFFFITSCGVQRKSNRSSDVLSFDTSGLYFPQQTFNDSSKFTSRDKFLNTWYSKQLSAMTEPVLFKNKSDREIYRFTWLRTFHNPVAIRIESDGNSCVVFWKLASGQGGYDPGKLEIDKRRVIDNKIWDDFKSQLDKIQFWDLPTNQKERSGFDGAQWILEGRTEDQYHVVDRWMPDHSTEFFHICNFLINLTDLKISEKEKY